MIAHLLCLVLAQSPAVNSPRLELIVEHDPHLWYLREAGNGVIESRGRLLSLTTTQKYDHISTELSQRNDEYSDNRAVQIVGMSLLLSAVANATLDVPGWERKPGKADPRLRDICRPYVDPIVLPELSIPAAPEVMEAQFRTVQDFRANSTAFDLQSLKADSKQRTEYVRRLCLVWQRMVKSCVVYREKYPEEVLSGEVARELPQPPKLRSPQPGSANPIDQISLDKFTDKEDRKLVEEYAKAKKDEKGRFHAATKTSELRKRCLPDLRREMEQLYGEDRKAWGELRQILAETIKNPEAAKLVIKDFTQRKKPGIWP